MHVLRKASDAFMSVFVAGRIWDTTSPMSHIFKDELFRDQVFVITGGGTGIGFAFAELVGSLGGKVAICGRREEMILAAQQVLEDKHIDAFAQSCDTRDIARVEAFVDAVLARYQKIDVLVNNAGGQFPTTAETLSAKGFEAVIRNNLLGTWNMTSAVATHAMIPAKNGAILNVIAQIMRGFPGMVHTGSARAGVDNMTKTLSVEWAQHHIRVNAIAPGVIRTSGTNQYPEEFLEMARRGIPMKRLGTVEEVTQLMAFMVSGAASFVTGQTYYVDGGQSLWGDSWQIPDNA